MKKTRVTEEQMVTILRSDAGEAEFTKRVIEFDEVHRPAAVVNVSVAVS